MNYLSRDRVLGLLNTLTSVYGPQRWWPADSRFEVMVGAVLTQNTNWQGAARALANLKLHGVLSAEGILALDTEALQGLLHPAGTYRVKTARLRNLCIWLQTAGGIAAARQQPTGYLRPSLLAISGIGPETADAILLYAFERPVFIADAYAFRLLGRLGWLPPLQGGYESLRSAVESVLPVEPILFNELHALIVRHGKESCRARPRCDACVLRSRCRYARSRAPAAAAWIS